MTVNQRTRHKQWGLWICTALWILLVSYLELRWWWKDHKAQIEVLMVASEGVLQGTPHWRAYQNRLLGPALVHLLGLISTHPLKTLAAICFLSSNALLFAMSVSLSKARAYTEQRAGLAAAIALLLPWLIWRLGSHFFSYPWDFLEMHLLLVLGYLALSTSTPSPLSLVCLFAVALTSRESALFVPVFILVRAWLAKGPDRWQQTVLAAALLTAGVTIVQTTRNLLFKQSILPNVGADSTHAALGNHMTWLINVNDWHTLIQTGDYARPFSLFICLTLFYAASSWWLWRRREMAASSFAVTMLVYMLALVPLAHLKEGRIYQPVGACTALLAYFIWLSRKRPLVSPKALQ